jgi:predicted methyltransferase MtxX (methanogen marker protein 4)
MTDLKVDYTLLDQSETSLSSLVSDFQNIKAQESSYDGALGSGDIASAMDSFAGNWDYHRKKLVGSMQALGTMISQTKQAFTQTDTKLQTTLTAKH